MQFMSGLVPVTQLTRTYITDLNIVEIHPTTDWTAIATVDIGPVYVGDRVLFAFFANMEQGIAQSLMELCVIRNSGPGDWVVFWDRDSVTLKVHDIAPGIVHRFNGFGMGAITTAGALQLMFCARTGANIATIPIGEAQIAVWVFPGS